MSKSTFTTQILLFEGIGFALVLSLLWLNEGLDLPHKLFGAPITLEPIPKPDTCVFRILQYDQAHG